MAKVSTTGKNPKLLAKKIIGYLIWPIFIIVLISTVRNIVRVGRIRGDVEKERMRLAKMAEENASLEAKIAQIQSPDFVEKQIRDKLGLSKEGEAIVVLPDEETLRKLAPPDSEAGDALPDPNWRKWMKLFF